ncbi:MAG TPA: NAD(P)H-binding protein [Trebonia sp.]|jgi:uncharacterized protein YbjT (DUF2867 family)|nr:NAD(P)H-binding protein [Trebonia sp.]
MSTFLILGGTGKVGRRVARVLERGGHVARAVSRSTGLPFDWDDPTTWGPALQDAGGIFIVGPGSATDWSPRLTALLESASGAGLRHAVLLSSRGVEFLPDGNVARAEHALRHGPLPWTILRPTHFAQNFTEAMFIPVDGRVIAPVGDGAEPFVDVEDIAEVAGRVLVAGTLTAASAITAVGTLTAGTVAGSAPGTAASAVAGATLALSGPRAITFAEAARILTESTGHRVEFRDQPDAEHAADLRAGGTPTEYIRWRLAMLGGIRRGDDAYLSDGITRTLGRPATDFTTWARRESRSLADDARRLDA